MRQFITICSLVAVALLALPGAALASAPVRGSSERAFVDPDFCGSGLPVTVHVDNAFVAHEKVVRGLLYFSTTYSGVPGYTYEPTGKTATVKYAAQSKDQRIV